MQLLCSAIDQPDAVLLPKKSGIKNAVAFARAAARGNKGCRVVVLNSAMNTVYKVEP